MKINPLQDLPFLSKGHVTVRTSSSPKEEGARRELPATVLSAKSGGVFGLSSLYILQRATAWH